MPNSHLRYLAMVALVLLALLFPTATSKAEQDKTAKIRIAGLGLWRDREMRVALERMLGSDRGSVLGANALEDTAFLLFSVLNDEGYQTPVIKIRVEVAGGKTETYLLDENLDVNLPPKIETRAVRFEVKTGPRSYVERVKIEGLKALDAKAGESFFKPANTLITTKVSKAYSPSRTRRSAEKLREELRLQGYAQARVEAAPVNIDKAKGGPVTLHVKVDEGPRWLVSDFRYEKADPAEIGFVPTIRAGQPWSATLQQNMTEELRRAYFKKGYADVAIRVLPEAAPASGGHRLVVAAAQIEPGPLVKVGEVHFEGNKHTSTTILRRRVRIKTGAPFDPVILENSRYRLSRLGVFEAVDLHSKPEDGEVRDPIFTLREGPRYETNLLAGYGSYEQLRGGVEFRQMNLFGRAHQSRFELVQSMKGTRGEYAYTVPELFGETIDGTSRVFGLQREELSFLRQEFGVNVTLKRQLPWLRAEGTAGYTLQTLKNLDNELTTRTADDKNVNVGSIELGITRDKRDSPLRPRRGYRWFGHVEAANQAFGGEVNYERSELGGAYHFSIGQWQFMHVALTHGVLTTYGKSDETIPVNKRFFPGGDSSIRGYQEGEAAPRGDDGRFIGAKTYTLLNLEYEQVLTEDWSAVLFFDGLGSAARLADYPFDERLYSIGIGIRYQTLVGPIRLEYGRNVKPRTGDPSGTIHLSIGFPF
ncbi:MAG: BamA/TamA family outer membrane protein [Nibricoccus sp.]